MNPGYSDEISKKVSTRTNTQKCYIEHFVNIFFHIAKLIWQWRKIQGYRHESGPVTIALEVSICPKEQLTPQPEAWVSMMPEQDGREIHPCEGEGAGLSSAHTLTRSFRARCLCWLNLEKLDSAEGNSGQCMSLLAPSAG